ncbi:DMT family transporter [Candidatus Daviesbacteria bacterium]|nr:DMT family transporter [Candidatus Daviesbacteria bacterium]
MTSAIFTKPWPYLALILAHMIWGGNFVVAKVTLQEFPVYSLAFLRFALASLFLAPFFLTNTKKVKIHKKDIPKLTLIGVLMITLNIAFFFTGIQKTTAINASVLTLIIPMLSVLLGWWFLKEKVYLINLAGIFAGLMGALIIIGVPRALFGDVSIQSLTGNFLIILASVVWVAGAIISRQMLQKYSSLTVVAFAFLIGMITFFPLAAFEYLENPGWTTRVSLLGILGLLYMTMLSSVSAYFLFEWGLAKTSVMIADLFQYIEPFVATTLAVLILSESLSVDFGIGAVLIAAGVYLGTFAKEAHHRHHKAHRI